MNQKITRYKRTNSLHKLDAKKSLLEKLFSSDTLLIASIPVFVYLFFYIRYSSYLNNLKIPISFIDFDLSMIIKDMIYSFLIFGATFGVIGGFITLLRDIFTLFKNKSALNYSTTYVLTVVVIFASGFFTSPQNLMSGEFVIVFCGILILASTILNLYFLIHTKYKGSLLQKVLDDTSSALSKVFSQFLVLFYYIGGKKFGILLMIYVGMLISASSLGKIDSISHKSFFVANTNPECIILYQTSERAICSPFNRMKKEIEPAYQIIYLKDTQNIKFTYEDIGPLHLKPTPTPTSKPTLTPTITKTPLPTNTPTETIIP